MSAAPSLTSPAHAPLFVLRGESPLDRRYVLLKWKQSEGECNGHVEGKCFAPWQEAMQEHILVRPGTRVIIAGPVGDDAIAGFAVVGGTVVPVVYYVFVRPECRRFGIAKLLLGDWVTRRDVVYCAKPPRVRGANGEWVSAGIPIPAGWRYKFRANYHEVVS